MKLVILGAGGLGSVIGAHLIRAGEDVTFIARGSRAAFLQQNGIIMTGLADFTAPVKVAAHPGEITETDVLIVTVKTYDTESALESVKEMQVDSVFSLQNGVMKNEQLARYFGWERVLGAATMVGGELMNDGSVRFTLNEGLSIGELSGEGISERVESLVTALMRAGIHAEAHPKIQTVEWSKFVAFAGGTALGALTRLEVYKNLKDSDLALVMARLMQETGRLAEKLGIALEDRGLMAVKTLCRMTVEEAAAQLNHLGQKIEAQAPTLKISTLQDLQRGRRIEVEETLGYAVRKGAELGLPMPTLETCYRLMAGVNRHLQ